MDLRYLRFFIAVAEEMNVTRAAERLNTVQPSVSRQIHRLEEIVGTPLFRRERHRLFLTDAGCAFLRESREILEQVDRAIELARQAAQSNNHRIAVGFILGTEGPIFARLVPMLRKNYPTMHISYQSLTELKTFSALENGTINAAFCAGPIDHPGIATECVLHQKLVVVLPSDHPLAELERIPVVRLAGMPLILPSSETSPNYIAFINQIARSAGIQLKAFIESDNVTTSLNSVGMGNGLCLIPEYQHGFMPDYLTVRSLELDPQPTLDLVVAYRRDDELPALKTFMAAVRQCFASPTPPTVP